MKITIKATEQVQKLAKEAWDIQDACNLCGLAQSFAKRMIELGDLGGTCARNQHPIAVLWIDKFASLAHCQDLGHARVGDAYGAVRKLMKGEDAEWELIGQ